MEKINKIQFALLFIVLVIAILPNAEARLTERIGVFSDYDLAQKKISISNLINPVVNLQLLDNDCTFNGNNALADCFALIKFNSNYDLDTSTKDYYLMDFAGQAKKLKGWDWKWFYKEEEKITTTYNCITGYENTTIYISKNSTYSYPTTPIMGKCEKTDSIFNEKGMELGNFFNKNKDYYIRLTGQIEPNSAVEWIPTFYGIKLTEWAWWLTNYTYVRNMISNSTITSELKNVTVPINGSEGWRNSSERCHGFTDLDVFPNSAFNSTNPFYYNSLTDTRFVNQSDNKELSIDWFFGNCTSRYPRKMYFNASLIAHLENTTDMDSSQLNNKFLVGTAGQVPSVVEGIYGKALAFDGINDNVTIRQDTDFGITRGLTLEAWVYKNGSTLGGDGHSQIAGEHIIGTNQWEWNFVILSTGVLHCNLWTGGVNNDLSSTKVVVTQSWQYVACTWDGSNLSMYFNGTIVASRTTNTGIITQYAGSYINIGRGDANLRYFNGSIDEFRLWNSSKTSDYFKFQYEMGRNNTFLGAEQSIAPSNTAPFIQNITITPAIAYTNSTLNCSANYGDAESDKGNVTINWTNGTTQFGVITILDVIGGQMISNSTIAGIQAKGETWNCTINATDSEGNTGVPNSTTREISNTLPEITSAVVMNLTSATKLTAQINCSFNHSDADTETLTDNFRWYKNNIFTGNTTSYITNRSFNGNDALICEGWVSDTTPANSSIVNSSSLAITNTAPQVTSVGISPATAYTDSTLNCSANFSDMDENDKLNATFIWYNASVSYSTTNKINILPTSTNNSFLLTAGIQASGEKWNCSVNAFDGSANSTTLNATITISPYLPTISLESPANRTNTTDNTPDFIFNYTNLDNLNGNCTLYVSNAVSGSNSSTASGKNTTITSTALSDGLNKQWYVNCTVESQGVSNKSEIRIIGIDSILPVITISKPSGEYFTYGLPYLNLPINFSYVEINPDSCWYNIDNKERELYNESYSNKGNITFILNASDSNWGTYATLDNSWASITQNFSNDNFREANFKLRAGDNCEGIPSGQTAVDVYCYNYSSKTFDATIFSTNDWLYPQACDNVTFSIPSTCLGNNISIRTNYTNQVSGNRIIEYYEGAIIYKNKSLTSCSNTTINTTLTGNHTLYLYMDDTFGNEGSSSTSFSINLLNASHWNNDADGNVSESEQVTFTLQINSTNITTINATFYYNNTAYTYTTRTNATTQANFTRVLLIPDLNATFVGYYWNYTINSHNNITDKYNLSVSELNATFSATCSAGMSASHNFSLRDEINYTALYGNVKYNIQYGINYSQYSSYGELYNVSSFQICINASISNNYSVGYGEIEYSVDGYSTRRYYLFTNSSLDNYTKKADLFNLPNSQATSFKFSAENYLLNPYIGYYLSLLRWYPENNTYKIVEMAKTNEEGETIMRVKTEDVDYRVGLYEIDGSLVKLTSPTKMMCLTTPCSYKISVLGDSEDYTSALGVETLITYASNIITFTWNDPSQKSEEIIFWVYKDTGYTYSTLCNTSSTSFTGVLNCNITGYTGTIVAKGYRKASPTIPIALRIISIRESIDKGIGLFAQLIMSIVIGFIAVWHPIAAILFSIIPFLIGWALGITTLQVIIALAVVGGAIIHMIGRAQAK